MVPSCYYYRQVRLITRVCLNCEGEKDKNTDTSIDAARSSPHEAGKEKINRKGANTQAFFQKKYLAVSFSSTPAAKINNRGVEYALSGKFKEAETLFKEVLREDDRFGAAYNNIGIIYEAFGYGDEAFKMYSRACMLEPDNTHFRENLLYLTDEKKK
jgi:tetratricopeptide (TPR) repeat protein